MKKVFLGINSCDEYVWAEIKKYGIISGFYGGHLYHDIYSESDSISYGFWCHDTTISSQHLVSGRRLPKNFKPNFKGIDSKMLKDIQKEWLTPSDTVSCEECGAETYSDALSYPDCPIRLLDCECVCTDCLTADKILLEFNEVEDLFKSRNLDAIDMEGYEEVETLFCDSSGWGHSGEAALTQNESQNRAQTILDENEEQLYCGLTGIGQFQVYATIYRKAS